MSDAADVAGERAGRLDKERAMGTFATDTTWSDTTTQATQSTQALQATRATEPTQPTEPIESAKPDNWTRIRRGLTPAALLVGPIMTSVGFAMHDKGLDDDVAFVRAIDGHVNRWMFTHLLIAAGFFLICIGTGAVARLARGRGKSATVMATVMIAVGTIAAAFDTVAHGAVAFALAGRTDVNAVVSTHVQLDLYKSPWIVGFVMLQNLALLGLFVLGFAMLRSRSIPRWAGILIIASPVTMMFGGAGVVTLLAGLPLVLGVGCVAAAARRAEV
jgi:hypothetical protein